jgi:hypothetical protein
MVVEEVKAMLFMTILTVSVLACCSYAVWPSLRSLWSPEGAKPRSSASNAATSVAARAPALESLEGVLVAQLSVGEISRRQYLRAMERIAARDDERHPLAVPPETGSEAGQ